jgi:hypothetical protein
MHTARNAVLAALLAAAFAGGAAFAQDDYGPPDSDIRQTVARLAYISGDVSFARGDDPDEWQPADANIPMTLGDRVWTADGRLELQVHGGNVVRLDNGTDLAALNLTEDTQQFSLSAGIASFQIRRLGDDDVFEVDTPNAAITFERTGDYRIDVRENGDTRLQVRRGRAIVASGGGQVPLGAGDAILIEGQEPPQYDMVAVAAPDGWDRWVADRDARYASVRSYQYVSPDIAGVEDLDRHGRWRQVPNYGWCWTPASVAVGWQPYRVGRWIWQDPWGWTWVSAEPWGWAPYHYGRWVTWRSSWYWVPVAPRVAVVAYSPALVAFVGGGPGFSVSVGVGTDYIGWFPLAPRDPLIAWWGRPAVNVNVTHVTYVNRTYVTVVNQTTFVSSGIVTNNYVRDRSVVSRVERAPVVTGAIPILPTRESIRVATRQAPAARPPASAVSRSVVTRVAPPAAPPRFDDKVAVIRENRGRPVSASEANRIVTRENREAPQPARAVRPAAGESGGVTLVPKTENSRAPKPEPVAPSRGRPLATREQPVAPSPERQAPARPQTPEMSRAQKPPQTQARPPAPEGPQTRERPTARPVAADPQPPAASRERSSQGPASPPPAPASGRQQPAPRPTPREASAHDRNQPRAASPREAEQPAAGVAPDSRQAKPAPAAAAAPPERGRERTAPRPTPTKAPKKEEKKKDDR